MIVSHGNFSSLFPSVSAFGALKSFARKSPLTSRRFAGSTGKGNDQVRVSV